ncbi:hypothetical protein EDD57_11027 [Baia soyae]|uniref:Uncharacterized protein n=2 Tax=Baia soyae TaxID=1544746 RepID=A0A4R2SA24_9BACL|nr:hypothetical protein EDD57_11027 [Baia soyae]
MTMEDTQLRSLRQKELLYTNILFVVYAVIVFGLIFSRASTPLVYAVLAIIFAISPLSMVLARKSNILYLMFPGMNELLRYEQEKLGDQWLRYQLSNVYLQVAVSLFFVIQAIIRPAHPFSNGLPLWYFLVVPAVLLILGNLNVRSQARRIDQSNYEQLKIYTGDRVLFTSIFAIVALVITGVVFVAYKILEKSWSHIGPF